MIRMKARLPHEFIRTLKQYNLFDVLKSISEYSSELFCQKESELTAAKFETLTLGYRSGRILITAWYLVDMAYLAILHCDGNKTIENKNDFFKLANLYNGYFQENERNQPFLKDKSKFNDFMLYLYGFAGEQFKFQNTTNTAAIMDNFCRNTYLLDIISKEFNNIDIGTIVYEEIGVTERELSAILWNLSIVALQEPFVLNAGEYYNKGIISEDKVKLVVDYFSSDIASIKSSKLKRQQLYATPFIKLNSEQYITNNVYLLLFLFENAAYWVVRNYFQKRGSQEFTNIFGDYFELYFKQLLETYLDDSMFHKIPEEDDNRADWCLEIGNHTFLIEQKSALTGLNAKQQMSDIDQTKTYISRNWLKALKQLHKTEQLYKKNSEPIIKIVLIYEDYFKDEILENAFNLEGNTVQDDGYYWLASIADVEMLLHTYNNNPDLFKEIIETKIALETSKSREGRELGQILNRFGVDTNEHIHSPSFSCYKTNLIKDSKTN